MNLKKYLIRLNILYLILKIKYNPIINDNYLSINCYYYCNYYNILF